MQMRYCEFMSAWRYYQLSWFLFVVRPDWSYLLNADFEDRAEHEYMELVTEHPAWEHTPFISEFADVTATSTRRPTCSSK